MVIVLHITVILQLYYRSITKATSMVVVHKYFDTLKKELKAIYGDKRKGKSVYLDSGLELFMKWHR